MSRAELIRQLLVQLREEAREDVNRWEIATGQTLTVEALNRRADAIVIGRLLALLMEMDYLPLPGSGQPAGGSPQAPEGE